MTRLKRFDDWSVRSKLLTTMIGLLTVVSAASVLSLRYGVEEVGAHAQVRVRAIVDVQGAALRHLGEVREQAFEASPDSIADMQHTERVLARALTSYVAIARDAHGSERAAELARVIRKLNETGRAVLARRLALDAEADRNRAHGADTAPADPQLDHALARLEQVEQDLGSVLADADELVAEETNASLWTLSWIGIGTALVSLAFAIPICIWLARAIGNPLRALRDVAVAFGAGALGTRSHISSADEIGALGKAFNVTAQAVQDSYALLQSEREELRAAKATAEAASRAKSEFLANMSHEIRNPMHGIFGMTEIALDTTDENERRDVLQRARRCAASLMTILDDILDFSKIEAGKLELQPVELALQQICQGVLDVTAIEANRKALALSMTIDPRVPSRLCGDPGRLRQILLNLLGNAIKFTDHGSVGLTAELASEDDDAVTLRCAVTDTGIGIPPARRAVIFDPFTQADGSITSRFGGTGLGLAISQRLVAMMGGEMGVASEVGRGSTFWFTARLRRIDDRDSTVDVDRSAAYEPEGGAPRAAAGRGGFMAALRMLRARRRTASGEPHRRRQTDHRRRTAARV